MAGKQYCYKNSKSGNVTVLTANFTTAASNRYSDELTFN